MPRHLLQLAPRGCRPPRISLARRRPSALVSRSGGCHGRPLGTARNGAARRALPLPSRFSPRTSLADSVTRAAATRRPNRQAVHHGDVLDAAQATPEARQGQGPRRRQRREQSPSRKDCIRVQHHRGRRESFFALCELPRARPDDACRPRPSSSTTASSSCARSPCRVLLLDA